MNIGQGQMIETAAPNVLGQQSTMTERLRIRRDHLRKDLKNVEDALAALEGNEEVARIVDAISKLGHF